MNQVHHKSRKSGLMNAIAMQIADRLKIGESVHVISLQYPTSIERILAQHFSLEVDITPVTKMVPEFPYEMQYDQFGEPLGLLPIEQTEKIVGYNIALKKPV